MNNDPKHVSGASKLMSQLTGQQRPANTLPRSSHKLSREQLLKEMTGFYNNCSNLILTCTAISVPLRRPELKDSEHFTNITKYANVLNQDLRQFGERLNGLKSQQNALASLTDDSEFHMSILSLGELYSSWMVEFTQVVVPNFQQLTTLVDSALPSETDTQSVPQEQQ